MNVVDSSAWLSYFAGDENSEVFSKPIEALDKLLVPTITIAEIFKNILLQRNEGSAIEAIAHMQQGTTVPLDDRLAVDAASRGVELKLPLADSIIYATAQRYDAVLWTQDSDFEGLRNVEYYPRSRTS